MNYQQTLDYLFTRLPMFSRIGVAAYKNDLTNTIRICEALGNPQAKFKSIHIAGTNGKGSTSHMLAAVLQTAGYKTGLYTSPHLKDFRERIKIDGIMCDEQFVIDFTKRVQPLIQEIEPSFFEITVAMAFEYFMVNKVDIAVIEVGLGGRLDSTNIITPELSIITNIGRDHMYLLGDTLEKIAWEKAGIIKQNVPVVIGEEIEETRNVFVEKATKAGTTLTFAQEERWVCDWTYEKNKLNVTVENHRSGERRTYHPDLTGLYQLKNILTVLESAHILKSLGWKLEEAHIAMGLSNVKRITGLMGRWEIIHQHPIIVLDVGHNEDGIQQIAEQLEISVFNQLHIVLGMVQDKEVNRVLSLLPKQAHYYFTQAQIPRALPVQQLALQAEELGLKGGEFTNVNEALQAAINHSTNEDLLLVCGSVFVVGEVEKSLLKFR